MTAVEKTENQDHTPIYNLRIYFDEISVDSHGRRFYPGSAWIVKSKKKKPEKAGGET